MKNIDLRKLIDGNGVVVIPDDVASIKGGTFSYMSDLKEVVIGRNVRNIEFNAFLHCNNLRKVTVLSNEITIYHQSFKGCSKLEEFDFLKVVAISHHSFENCASLKEVNLSSKIDILSETAFLGCLGIEKFDIDVKNEDFTSIDGVVYSKDLTELLFYPCAKKDKVFKLGDKVNVIKTNAFSCAKFLEDVDLNDVLEIKGNCFENCINLKKVKLSKKVRYISEETFKGCLRLEDIDIPNNVISIDKEVFSGCQSIKEIYLGDSVSYIGSEAFKDCCNLEKLSIPKSVEKIGKNFIDGVKEGLVISYGGTEEEWMKLVEDRSVCVSHQTQNDFHYYGDDVDKYVPNVWENEIVIPKSIKYKLIINK